MSASNFTNFDPLTMGDKNYKKKKRFIIETEWDTGFWAFLPMISWNIHFCEIELRWLCGAIMFRDDKRFSEKRIKQMEVYYSKIHGYD